VVALTRGSQNVFLSARGDERLPTVTTADLRLSRAFKFDSANRTQVDFFNINNSAAIVALTSAVGGSCWCRPFLRHASCVGFSVNF
jgi:hypothetical protein